MPEKLPYPKKAKRIISVVPSQTELLFDLGLNQEVIGITKFCIHPNEWFRNKTRIGGTKNLHIEKILALQPDLVLANKEENTKEDIEKLQSIIPTYISDIQTIEDAFQMIHDIGKLVDRESKANEIIHTIKLEQSKFQPSSIKKSCLYLIWNKPYMAAGKNTFIDTMLYEAGFENCLTTLRYPELSEQEIQSINPDCIFLSSEPFPFKQQHIDELALICPKAIIKLVDGELFSWYGCRMSQSFKYFRALNEELLA